MAHAENAIWDPQTTVYGQLLGLILASNPFAIWNRRHDLFFFFFFFFCWFCFFVILVWWMTLKKKKKKKNDAESRMLYVL